ncbi:MAG TPA: hypothetical protein VGQ46_07090 [Thermoanaerobaculia bacterium]|jgi:hypothetical protein|nr:hypothetical protein [Thermoanaerobaculia bacterium]
MKRNLIASAAVCVVVLASTCLQASQPVTLKLPDSGSLQMSVPDDWKLQQDVSAGALNLRLTSAGKDDFMVLMTVIPAPADTPLASAADVRKVVVGAGNKQLSGALQKELELTEVETAEATGYLYHITDKNAESGPGDYREGNQGIVLAHGRLISVTILTHTGGDAIVKQAFEVLKTLRISGEPQKGIEPDRLTVTALADKYEITVPVSSLLMAIPKEHFMPAPDLPGGATASRRYFQLADATKNLIVSGWFEPQEEFKGIETFWAGETAAWKQNKLPSPEAVEFKKIGTWDTVAYQIPLASGSNPHIRAHWLQAGTWIDLHLSMTSDLSKQESMRLLASFLSQIRVSAKSGS